MIRFPNEHVNVNKLDIYQHNHINTLVILAETKSEDQWQSEHKRSKFA